MLCATSSIIVAILKRTCSQEPWTGYTVYGQNLQPFRSFFGKYNIPGEHAFNVLSAKRLLYLHEIGHEYAYHLKPIEGFVQVRSDVEKVEEEFDFQREIIADIYCFQQGFSRDLTLYIRTVHDYFNPMIAQLGSNHSQRLRFLHRLFAIYCCSPENETHCAKIVREYDDGMKEQSKIALDHAYDRLKDFVWHFLMTLKNEQYTIEIDLDGDAFDHFFAASHIEEPLISPVSRSSFCPPVPLGARMQASTKSYKQPFSGCFFFSIASLPNAGKFGVWK